VPEAFSLDFYNNTPRSTDLAVGHGLNILAGHL